MAEPAPQISDDETVTVVTSRRVRPGCEAAFEAWLEQIGEEAARFPGLIGRRVSRPDAEHPEYVVVFKFDSYAHLRAWTTSEARRAWLAKVEPLVIDELKETVLTGLERWFTLPARPGLAPPPAYKMAVVSLLVVYPLSQGLGALVGPAMTGLPRPLQGLVVSAIMIGLMTWVVMPRVTRLLRRWLYPPGPAGG